MVDRKASVPKGGKGSAVLVRVTQEMRDALDQEALRTGRSIAQVTELWLEQARTFQVLGPTAPDVTNALQTMIRIAKVVGERWGDPARSVHARDVLRTAWQVVAKGAIPHVADDSPAAEAVGTLRRDAIRAHQVASQFEAPAEVLDILARLANARLHGDSPDWLASQEGLIAAAAESAPGLAAHLRVVAFQMSEAMALVQNQISHAGDPTADARDVLASLGLVVK